MYKENIMSLFSGFLGAVIMPLLLLANLISVHMKYFYLILPACTILFFAVCFLAAKICIVLSKSHTLWWSFLFGLFCGVFAGAICGLFFFLIIVVPIIMYQDLFVFEMFVFGTPLAILLGGAVGLILGPISYLYVKS